MKNVQETRFDALVEQARKTNKARDRSDREMGVATPAECSQREWAKTALAALSAGIRWQDESCLAEAYVLLEELANELS